MSEDKNVAAVKELFEGFSASDLDRVLACVTDDVEVVSSGPEGAVPWAGTFRGRDGMAKNFAAYDAVEYEDFRPLEYIAKGDRVMACGRERWRAKETGATCEQDWVILFTVREGKIARMHVFEDTAAVAQAIGALQVVGGGRERP